MSGLPVRAIKSTTNGSAAAGRKSWSELVPQEKIDRALDQGFKYLVAPVSAISAISSVWSFISANLLKNENEFLGTVSSWFNKLAYFINGIYGGIGNSFSKNWPGALGYSLVSLASIIGDEDNMYLLKGPGSALDQMPATLADVCTNPEIKKIYGLEDGKEKTFNEFEGLNSIGRTFTAVRVVCQDVIREFNEKKSKGFLKAISEIFITDEKRRAERNLVLSSLGLLTGAFIGLGTKFKRLGSSIRDIAGGYADLALLSKKNVLYKLSGVGYTFGSLLDLIYRWVNIPKLNLAAVGLDNAGFCFMNLANLLDNKKVRNQEPQATNNTNANTSQPGSGEPPKLHPLPSTC